MLKYFFLLQPIDVLLLVVRTGLQKDRKNTSTSTQNGKPTYLFLKKTIYTAIVYVDIFQTNIEKI